MSKCKHCLKEIDLSDKPKGFMANHVRWCSENPKRSDYNKSLDKARANRINFNNQYTYGAVCSEETKEKLRNNCFKGKRHTEETKELLRQKALASPHRRMTKGMFEYNGIELDSVWELELAKRLDQLNIKWIRPEPLVWFDNEGINHHYFPDFYLIDYDLYLDPKNNFARVKQKEKLDSLLKQFDNIFILETLEDCKNFSVDKLKSGE